MDSGRDERAAAGTLPAERLADTICSLPLLRGSVAHRRHLPGCAATFAAPRVPLRPELESALQRLGISRLYSHQEQALHEVSQGRNVLTVTPTASGKSLVYMLPTLDAILRDPQARALYLFPYKALEQDQLESLRRFIEAAGMQERASADIYDGDTPQADRRRLRAQPPHVLITNPDMLHMSILAYHDEWRALFENLRFVVIDEMHVYRGIFGSHVHHVLRRLARVCRKFGAAPRIVASSATIGNPGEFAARLIGAPFSVIDESGAPRPGRHMVFVNPSSGSPYTAATRILEQSMRAGLRTIAFTKARRITELLTTWLHAAAPDLTGLVASYRAGYLPSDRRRVEQAMAAGSLRCVISTSALEHGIDIGGLDVCVLMGYPGSIMSSWQRAGRVGREDRESLAVMVALPDALDQYFMANPEEFFRRGPEPAALDPDNAAIAGRHLVCAGAEIPLTESDRAIYSDQTFGLIPDLARQGGLVQDAAGNAWYSLRRHPQRDVNLRALGAGYDIVEQDSQRAIGSVDGVRAFVECHPGAVYLHQGQQFEVLELDRDKRRAVVRRAELDYFTQVLSEKETEILEVTASRTIPGCRLSLGRLRVTQEFKEFVRRRIADQQTLSAHPLELPPVIYETVGLWWDIPHEVREESARRQHHFMGSIHASEHAAISLFPLLTLCDRTDVGGISYPAHPQTGGAAVFIYDGTPGGIGLAAQGFARIEELLGLTLRLIADCDCAEGCPSCIHSPRCGNGNVPLDKQGARFVLESLLRADPPARLHDAPALIKPSVPPPPQSPAQRPVAARQPARDAERLLFFDVETQRSAEEVGGWDRIGSMGLALAIVYDELEERYRTYLEADVDRLIVDLFSADLVVGFNVKRFDYGVLRGYREAAYHRIPTCDLLEQVHQRLGFRLRLNSLAEATLGEAKSADGLQSLQWYREGRMDLIEEYCRKDVDVTRRLFHFARRHGHLLYRDREQRLLRVEIQVAGPAQAPHREESS